MTAIMIFHIRSKYTAVGEYILAYTWFSEDVVSCLHCTGRKEIIMFFYMYALAELLAIFLDAAIIPTSSNVYPVR